MTPVLFSCACILRRQFKPPRPGFIRYFPFVRSLVTGPLPLARGRQDEPKRDRMIGDS